MEVMRAALLLDQGATPQALSRLASTGRLVRVRHGAYAEQLDSDSLARHRQLLAGTWPLLGGSAVLSHESAAALHRLPLWDGMLERVSITRDRGGHGRTAPHLRVRLAPLPDTEVTELEGYRVTSIERTALDLARGLPYEQGVAVLDAALHRGGDRLLLADLAARAQRCHGIATARAALAFADGRAESVGESLSRVRMGSAGLPLPELQVNVYDEAGDWVARSDFGWVKRGVLGEFDGRVKYTGTPQEVAAAVMQEKRREDRLRQLGWVVVRWTWAELATVTLRSRIEAAFAQAHPDAISGSAVPLPRS